MKWVLTLEIETEENDAARVAFGLRGDLDALPVAYPARVVDIRQAFELPSPDYAAMAREMKKVFEGGDPWKGDATGGN